MNEREKKVEFAVVSSGPKIYRHNETGPDLTVTTFNIESAGQSFVQVEHFHESGFYLVRWENTSISANDFLTNAQAFVREIKSHDEVKPANNKFFSGLDYQLNDNGPNDGLREVEMSDFSRVAELDSVDLDYARFNTLYGDFIYQASNRDIGENSIVLSILTHVNSTEELSQFVSDNISSEIPTEMLRKLLLPIGSEARQRQEELAAAKQNVA